MELFYGIDTSNAKTKLGGTRSSGEVIHHFRYFWVLLWVEITQIFENFQNFKISICDRYTRRKVCSKIYLESESQGERILTLSRKSEHFSKQGGDTGGAPPASLMNIYLASRLPYQNFASLIPI